MKILCPAKINFFLKITGMRDDGYHSIQSLIAPIDLYDELEIRESKEFSIEISGKYKKFIDKKNNLLTKILDFFVKEFSIKPDIFVSLKKNIPVGAGLGGGSSDAAELIKALNKIFSLNLEKDQLQKLSLNFGSDIPFFFENRASLVSGRGEILESFPNFKPFEILIVNPEIFLSTKEIFMNFSHSYSKNIPSKVLKKESAIKLAKNIENELTKTAISICPSVEEVIDNLKRFCPEVAKMSGSGSTCFAIFNEEKSLLECKKFFEENFPNFFILQTKVRSRTDHEIY